MAKSVEALVNPALLVWARETSGLSVDDAARRVGVATDKLAAWEKGEARPTIVQLRTLARVYKRPFAAFYLPEPPATFSVPHDYRTLADAAIPRMSPELRAEIRRIQYQREIALEVAQEGTLPEADFLGTGSLQSNVESLAVRVRVRLGITSEQQRRWANHHDAFKTWRTSLEQLNVLVCQLEGVDVDEARGLSVPHRSMPLIAVNAKDSPTARTFTLFHEFAHLLLNSGGLCDLEDITAPSSSDQRSERFCNAFAAALLLPRAEVASFFGGSALRTPREWPDEILRAAASQFNVSREVVLRRLVTLGAATFQYFMAKRHEFRAEYAELERKRREGEKKKGGPSPAVRAYHRVGPAFARLVIDAYDREDITTSDLAEYLGVRLKHLPRVRKLAFSAGSEEGGER